MTGVAVDDFTGQLDAAVAAGPAWLEPVRRAAFAQFERLGFPTTRNEDWHYTSPARIAEGGFVLAGVGGAAGTPGVAGAKAARAARAISAADIAPFRFGHAEWPTLVFVNGRYQASLSSLGALPTGVRVQELGAALADDRAFVEARLAKVAQFDEHAFTALNTAFVQGGAIVHVAAGVTVEPPIHLLFVSTGDADGCVTHPRVIVSAGRNSKATVIESWVAVGAPRYFTNTVTEVDVADGATVTHLRIQRESEAAMHVGTVQVAQGRDSHFVSFSFATGGQLARTNVYTHLNGAGCGSTLNGLYLASGTQHIDHQTRIEHVEPNCYSREVYKGVLDGEGHGVFNGKVFVHPAAQKTDGKQENHTLLLSDDAQMDTKPQLEIFADDVKCTHGATIGRIDANAEFYMRSRGVSAEFARRLLVYAFAADVLERIELEPVRVELERIVLARFAGGEVEEGAWGR